MSMRVLGPGNSSSSVIHMSRLEELESPGRLSYTWRSNGASLSGVGGTDVDVNVGEG